MSNSVITVKFFASLSELLGKRECSISTNSPLTLNAIWEQSSNGIAMPEKLLMSINMEYAKPDSFAEAGDEVAFFPPVTGG